MAEVMTAKRFEAPGRPGIAYDEAGDPAAPPVVLLHGGAAGDRRSWFEIVPRLASGFRVYAPDMRGHGESGWTPGEYSLDDYASDVEAFVEQVAGGPVALVGHSLGGMVAAHVTCRRPDLVRRVFFEDAPLIGMRQPVAPPTRPFRRGEFRDQVERLIDGDASPAELMGAVVTQWLETRNMWPAMQELLRALSDRGATVEQIVAKMGEAPAPTGTGTMADLTGEATRIHFMAGLLASDPGLMEARAQRGTAYDPSRPMTCPVLMLRADPAMGPPPIGACFLPEDVEPFLAAHPNASVEFVEGASHGIHMERPAWFAERLAAFLAVSPA